MSVAVDSDAEDDAVSEIAEAAGVSPAPAKPSMSAPRRMLLSAWSSSSLWRCCCVAGDFASSGHAMRRTSVVTSCKRPGSAR